MPLRLHPLPRTSLRLSSFCCGLGDLFSLPLQQSDAVLDAFVEAGGNFFDTAHAYSFWIPGGIGQSEIGIGDYVRRRGLKDVTIATKGGHPSAPRYRTTANYLSPERVSADIDDSLARLECDSIALYYLHRDDTRVPAEEIIDALNQEIGRGRLEHLGASNWGAGRIAQANDYAQAKNLAPFVISQPLWSLATHRNGSDLSKNGEVAWHRETQMAVAPYSPTAHGWFDGEEEDNYQTPENYAKRERVEQLAKQYGATPGQISLAWLLSQPFATFPILGTKDPARLRAAMGADALRLGEAEVAWLETGDSAADSSA